MSAASYLGDVQQLVLQASWRRAVHHRVLRFHSREGGIRCLGQLLGQLTFGPDRQACDKVDCALGLSFRGLEALEVPPAYLGLFRRLAPAFAAGAVPRAAARLGDTGPSAATRWEPAFAHRDAHALVTMHGKPEVLAQAVAALDRLIASTSGVESQGKSMAGMHLRAPPGHLDRQNEHWVHFGYRDGLSRPCIEGLLSDDVAAARAHEIHEPGELLLGEARDLGDNPWALPSAPQEVRAFFRHGSFAAMRCIAQDERSFRRALARWADHIANDAGRPTDAAWREPLEDFIRAKLCGRWPDGQPVTPEHLPGERPPVSATRPPMPDFATQDPDGHGCPFGAHIRRMNPQGHEVALSVRPRPLFRRGMPYGPWYDAGTEDAPRGLLGLFFCSDIEDQFEHLLGEWADRMPMGFTGAGDAKDPLIGAHEDPRATLVVPRPKLASTPPGAPWTLHRFEPFVRTLGTLYAFYPSRPALETIINRTWRREEEPWLVR